MRANCWKGKRKVQVDEVPDPQILTSRDAIVRITSTAICGSDLHLYNGLIPTMVYGYEIFLNKQDDCVKVVLKP
jgi:threonine dehydrogenase-like Zn-dependent dehydrogenase